MKNAILVPGRPDKDEHYDPKRPSNSEDHWFSWLKRQLILKDIHAVSIEPPFPFRPRYEDLSDHKDLKVGKVLLVAPWINPLKYEVSDTADFFDFAIDPDFPTRTEAAIVFISSDDEPSVVKTVEILREKVKGLKFKEYTDKGHFVIDSLGTEDFPDLLSELLA